MLSTEEMDALYDKALTPFTDCEWTLLSEHYKLKNPLENIYAHLLEWSEDVSLWTDYLCNRIGPKPGRRFWEYLHPCNYEPNPFSKLLNDINKAATAHDYGAVPRIAILPYVSKAILHFIEMLDYLYHAASLDDVKRTTKEYFKLLLHQGPCEMTRSEFFNTLTAESDLIKAAWHHYANDLGVYINQQLREGRNTQPLPAPAPIVEKGFAAVTESSAAIEKAVVKGAAKITKAVRKPRGKRAKFSVELQDEVYAIHLKAKNNAEVKKNSKTSSSFEAEFNYSRKKLVELGILDVNAFKSILKAHSNRRYNTKKRSSS